MWKQGFGFVHIPSHTYLTVKDNVKNDKIHNVFVNESNKRCKIESVQKTFFQIINEIITIHFFTAMAGNDKWYV